MPTLICDTCGKPFTVYQSQVGVRRRCSIACKDTRIPVTCEACGKVFLRPAWHRNAGWKRTFCSVKCSRSPHTATFVGTQPRHAIRWDRLQSFGADLAYFVGLMITDGNVRENGAINFVSLDQCSTEFVRDFISPDATIREERTKAGNTAYRWSLWSKPLVAEFGRLGVFPKKSLTAQVPAIPDRFVWDFLRGVLDGDGSVDQAGRAIFTTGSAAFAGDLMALFRQLDLKASLFAKRRAYSVMLNVPSSRVLAARIYRDGCPHLARKRARFH